MSSSAAHVEAGLSSVILRIQARDRSGATGAFRVEMHLTRDFIERMQQLRSLVPPPRSLTAKLDLEIDKVRARLPNARWWEASTSLEVHKSGIVIGSDGCFACLASAPPSLQLRTASIPVSRVVQFERMCIGPEVGLQAYGLTLTRVDRGRD